MPKAIQVGFTSGETRGLTLRPHSVFAKPASLVFASLVNVPAVVVTLLWAQGRGDLAGPVASNPGALPFFLIGTLVGPAADGSARLVALTPLRREIHKAALNNELLTGAAIVFLGICIIFTTFGCLVALIGLF